MSVIIIILVAAVIVTLGICLFRAREADEDTTSKYGSMSNDELRNDLEMKLNRRCSR